MTRRTTWPHGGVDGPHPALLGGQGEVLVVASHGVLDVGRHHIVVSHVGAHSAESRARSTSHVVRMSHGIALRSSRETTTAHVLTVIGRHRTHTLVVVHRTLVSLLGHVHLRTWVWRGSTLTAKHPRVGMMVHWHPHVNTGTSGSDGHVAHVGHAADAVHVAGPHPRVLHHLHHLHLAVHAAVHVVHPSVHLTKMIIF